MDTSTEVKKHEVPKVIPMELSFRQKRALAKKRAARIRRDRRIKEKAQWDWVRR